MKPRIPYADLRWMQAFAQIQEGQVVSLNGELLKVHWKHTDPNWLQLTSRKRKLMVRSGDPLIYELHGERL